MHRFKVLALALVVGAVTMAAGFTIDRSPDTDDSDVLGPGEVTVEIDIEHSRFDRERIEVRPGTQVRFVLSNGDPIAHEFILGDEDVHERHATGTENEHPAVPGEVSLPPGENGETTFLFDEPGTLRYVCHLPGHEAYGMEGEVVVS